MVGELVSLLCCCWWRRVVQSAKSWGKMVWVFGEEDEMRRGESGRSHGSMRREFHGKI